MGYKAQLEYAELDTIVKKFRDEGEDIVQMRASMHERVLDLQKDWVGAGADKFFSEMENDLLPALARLAGALFLAQDVLLKIIKTIQTSDEETAGYFKGDLGQFDPANPGATLGTGETFSASQAGSGQTSRGDQIPGAGG
ncbi:MAG: WXG100 family type VII secretion target [Anaerolineales bacterium]